MNVCPCCGYCPHCGRKVGQLPAPALPPFIPGDPWVSPYTTPYQPPYQPYVVFGNAQTNGFNS